MVTVDYQNKTIVVTPENIDENDRLIKYLKKIPDINYDPTLGWIIKPEHIYMLNDITAQLTNNVVFQTTSAFKQWCKNNKLGETLIIYADVLKSKIQGKNIPIKELDDACKYFFKPAVRHAAFKQKRWDGYVRLFSRKTNRFPTGLLYKVTEVLDRLKRPYHIIYTYERRPPRQFDWVANDKITPDPDQIEAIKAADRELRGVIKAPTGFGKTAVLAVGIIANFGVPSLFVANKKALLDDAKKAFVDLIDGITEDDVDEIKDGQFGPIKLTSQTAAEEVPELKSKIIVATIQSINARLQDKRTAKQMKKWLNKHCKLVMVDECQAVGTKMWDTVLNQCKAPLRFCLSATPKRTDGASIKINAQSGDCIFFTTAEEQVAKGRLCELDIQYKPFDHKLYNEKDKEIQYNEAYTEWIVNNPERNRMIAQEVINLVNEGRFTLVLINRIDHGYVLYDALVEAGLNRDDIRFIYGRTPNQVRQNSIHAFRKGEFKVLIGSTIFDAGVNIPVVSGVVIAGAGNSEITLIQKIGRGARNVDYEEVLGYLPEFMKKNPNQKVTKVVDILDENVKFFTRQAWNRYKIAKEEFGASRVKIVGQLHSVPKKRAKIRKQIDQFASQLEMLEGFDSNKSTQTVEDTNLTNNQFDFLSAFKK